MVQWQVSAVEDSSESHFWGHALSTLQIPQSPDTRWCHGSLLACKCVPKLRFNCYDSPICHRIMFITHSFEPTISVWTPHAGCVMNPPDACLVIQCFRSTGLLPSRFLPSLFLPVHHISKPPFFIFHKETFVNKAAHSKGPYCNSRGRQITLPDGVLMLQWISRCSNSS